MKTKLAKKISANWYLSPWRNSYLAPLWLLFIILSNIRRCYYRLRPPKALFTPVVIVGNISVGGTGKTPFIEYLLEQCHKRNLKAGVISRGYGGKGNYPLRVNAQTGVAQAGDEAVMLYHNYPIPLAVDPKRPQALASLLNENLDVVFSDDGLQHYALARDYEIVLIDGARGFGNGWCLPIGPLREPIARLQKADLVLTQGQDFILESVYFKNLKSQQCLSLNDFIQQYKNEKLHAIAGIGNPQRFFNSLKALGLDPKCQSFSDHHPFSKADLNANIHTLMTEKDAIKCVQFASNKHWYLKVKVKPKETMQQRIDRLLTQIQQGTKNG